jgi:hypothetical protein
LEGVEGAALALARVVVVVARWVRARRWVVREEEEEGRNRGILCLYVCGRSEVQVCG